MIIDLKSLQLNKKRKTPPHGSKLNSRGFSIKTNIFAIPFSEPKLLGVQIGFILLIRNSDSRLGSLISVLKSRWLINSGILSVRYPIHHRHLKVHPPWTDFRIDNRLSCNFSDSGTAVA